MSQDATLQKPPQPELNSSNPVDDLAALWPEVTWPYVNVLCEGPSIKQFSRSDLLKGPVVAVNRTICLQNAQAHLWATTDDPRHLWTWSEPHRREGLRYFTTDTNLLMWQQILGEDIKKVYSTPMTDMGQDDADGKIMTLPTLIPLLCWLLRVGSKRVRLFGCDMFGFGGSVEGPGHEEWSEKSDRHWDSRWLIERVLLAHVSRLYRANGARVERWNPLRSSPSRTSLPPPR